MNQPLTLKQKLLYYIYSNGRNYKPPLLVDVHRLAKTWSCTAYELSHLLSVLHQEGKIRPCDIEGNPPTKCSAGQLLLQVCLDNGRRLLWDKASRVKLARQLGIKHKSLERAKRRLRDFFHVEYDENLGNPIPVEIFIMDEGAAMSQIGDARAVKEEHYGMHYYKYVKGWAKPKPKEVAKSKPKRMMLKHHILAELIRHGGTYWGTPTKFSESMGLNGRSFRNAMAVLEQKGVAFRTPNRVEIRDPEAASLLLSPFGVGEVLNPSFRRPIPPNIPPAVSSRLGKVTLQVTAYEVPPYPQKAMAVVNAIIGRMIVKYKIQSELARMLVRYPRNYANGRGKGKVQAVIDNWRQEDNAAEDELRRKYGAIWGKRTAICTRILESIGQQLSLAGSINDELITIMVETMKSALPSIEIPDRDAAEKLAEWIDNDLPGQDQCIEWLDTFVEKAGCEFLSQFVVRHGIDLIFDMMSWCETNMAVQHQMYAWWLHLYMAYVEYHPFNEKFPDAFQTSSSMIGKAISDCESLLTGVVVTRAISTYLQDGYKLGSLVTIKHTICKKLAEDYPIHDDGEIAWVNAFDDVICRSHLAGHSEFGVLCDWMDEYDAKTKDEPSGPERWTVQWYEAKVENAREYGLPGDIELLNQKIAGLKRWHTLSQKEQKKLVGLLNKPGRYDDPRLNWAQWDEVASYWNRRMEGATAPRMIRLGQLSRNEDVSEDDDGEGYDDE
jgi:hypothetical protein